MAVQFQGIHYLSGPQAQMETRTRRMERDIPQKHTQSITIFSQNPDSGHSDDTIGVVLTDRDAVNFLQKKYHFVLPSQDASFHIAANDEEVHASGNALNALLIMQHLGNHGDGTIAQSGDRLIVAATAYARNAIDRAMTARIQNDAEGPSKKVGSILMEVFDPRDNRFRTHKIQ